MKSLLDDYNEVKLQETVTLDSLRLLVIRCELEGRTAQANLIRAVIRDIEVGVPWLDLMNGKGVA